MVSGLVIKWMSFFQVLCEILIAMVELNITHHPDVERDVMTPEFRDMEDSTDRNLRDWLIIRDYMIILEYVRDVLRFFLDHPDRIPSSWRSSLLGGRPGRWRAHRLAILDLLAASWSSRLSASKKVNNACTFVDSLASRLSQASMCVDHVLHWHCSLLLLLLFTPWDDVGMVKFCCWY